jgi:prepilin-type N-terminal cleavage/methylation domain-containing protein
MPDAIRGASAAERRAQRAAGERSRVARGRPRAGTRQSGFTLIEVLVAVLLLGLVVGSLVVSVQQNLSALAGAREDLERLRLAEGRLRELQEDVAAGTPPETGHTEGTFPAPDDGYAWDLAIDPFLVPLPPGVDGDIQLSSVFPPGETSGVTVQPSVFRVEYRVYPVDSKPEEAEPFVLLLVKPIPPDLAEAGAAGAGAQDTSPAPRSPLRPPRDSRASPGASR